MTHKHVTGYRRHIWENSILPIMKMTSQLWTAINVILLAKGSLKTKPKQEKKNTTGKHAKNERPLQLGTRRLERWLGSHKHLLLVQRTWILFQHPHSSSSPSITSSPGGPVSSSYWACVWHTYTQADKTLRHIKTSESKKSRKSCEDSSSGMRVWVQTPPLTWGASTAARPCDPSSGEADTGRHPSRSTDRPTWWALGLVGDPAQKTSMGSDRDRHLTSTSRVCAYTRAHT